MLFMLTPGYVLGVLNVKDTHKDNRVHRTQDPKMRIQSWNNYLGLYLFLQFYN